MERRTFNAGDTIFRAGEASDCAYLLVVGNVDVHLPNGLTKRLGPGEIFGEMGLVDDSPRSASVTAADYCVCATYNGPELLDSIRSRPDEAVAFIRALIGRLRDANEGR